MELWEAFLLGIVQGLTEWLPVSSSGHLALVQMQLGEVPLLFDILLHVATMAVLLVYFREEIVVVCREARATIGDVRGGEPFHRAARKNIHRRMAWMVLVGTVPTAIVGILLDAFVVRLFYSDPLLLGAAFIFTGFLLLASRDSRGAREARNGRLKERGKALDVRSALLVGLAQSLALLPGVSRSGSTISVGLMEGMDARTAGRFSFLLAVPAVLGATVLNLGEAGDVASDVGLPALVAGTLASAVVGYLSLVLLFRVLETGRLHYFAPYVLAVGIMTIFLA